MSHLRSLATNRALRNWAFPAVPRKVRTPPVWTDNKGKNRTIFFLFFDILVTVPLGTLNMHLKFEMPQKYKIKALSMQIVYVCMYIYIDNVCIHTYIYIDLYLLDIFKG